MDKEAALSIQHTAKIIKSPTDVQIRHIHMPVLMGSLGLFKAFAFSRAAPRFQGLRNPASLRTR
jgi:hypothetical protein